MLAFPDSRKVRISSNKLGTDIGSKFSTFSALRGTHILPKKINATSKNKFTRIWMNTKWKLKQMIQLN